LLFGRAETTQLVQVVAFVHVAHPDPQATQAPFN